MEVSDLKFSVNKAMESVKINYGGLPRSIYILFYARIINKFGGFVYAFLAFYMKTKLGMSEGAIADYVLINGAVSMMSPFIGGYVADKKGRKAIFVFVQLLGSMFFIACGFLTDTRPEVIPKLLIIASFLYNMVGPISNAMVADITDNQDDRRRSYSLLYLGINIGVAVGPLLGGFLLINYVKWFFFGDAITTIISVFLVALFVKETMLTGEEMKKVEGGEKMESGVTALIFIKKPVLLLYAVFAILNSAVYAQMGFGLSLHMDHVFGEEFGAAYYGMLLSFNAVVVLVFTIALTELLKRFGPVYNVALSALLNTLGFGMIAFIGSRLPLFFVSVFIWTVAEIVMVTNSNVFIMSHTPVNYRGRFSAFIGFLMGVGFVVSPRFMSFMMVNYSYETAWKGIGIISIIAFLGFMFTGYVDKKINGTEHINEASTD
jgi:MFS family permease